jgi:hypothetical protein
VLILLTVVVVEVEDGDAGLEELEGGVDAAIFFGIGEMSVAEVEGDADVAEVADVEDLEEVFGSGDFVLEVFEDDLHAEGMGEGFDVLYGSKGVLKSAEVPGVVLDAEVEGECGEGDLLGSVEGALDLVHGGDTVGFFGVYEIDVGRDVTGPLTGAAVAEVKGLVKGGDSVGVAEPGGDVADGGAVGVIEVVAGGEDLDDGAAVRRETAVHGVEQARVQTLLQEDVG